MKYKVKVTVPASDKERLLRQLPGKTGIWKNYQFYINEPIEEADFWVVCYQKLTNKTETCRVAPENTMYITWEPDSVYHFSKGFLNQFGRVVSCQEHLKHKNLVKDQPGLAWWMGMWNRPDGQTVITQDYDSFSKSNPKKSKLISVIASNKTFTKGHRERLEFVKKLKAHFGDQLDLYGRGFHDFDNKWDAIADYEYHIVIENCSIPYYWSEKLADAFLGNSFPFYYGCSNVDKYFSKDAFRAIDLHDADEAIKVIDQAIEHNLAEKNSAAVECAKQQVLNEYNFFELVVKNLESMDASASKKSYTIKGDMAFIDFKKFIIYGGRILSNIKYKVFGR